MKFRCWVPDEGYERTDATDIEASDAAEAAELFAERWYEGGDPFPSVDVAVVACGDSADYEPEAYRVTVDFDPSFYAARVK